MQLIDQKERQQAMDPMHSWIVSAPAGSGKTYLLTRRILNLFMHVNHPSHVVAITFTKKAAYEMQERLLGCLENPTEDIANQVLKRSEILGWDIINQPESLAIMTIDAYCAWLLAHTHNPTLLPVSQSPDRLYSDVIYQYFKSTQWDSAQQALLAAFHGQYNQLETLLINLLATRDQWMIPLSHTNLTELCKQGLEQINQQHLMQLSDRFANYQENINSLFNIHREIVVTLDEPIIYQALCPKTKYSHLADMLLTKTGEFRKSLNKKQGIYPKTRLDGYTESLQKQFKACYFELQESIDSQLRHTLHETRLLPTQQEAEEHTFLAALSNVLSTLTARLADYFTNNLTSDFSNISLTAINKLEHCRTLQNFCRSNIHHLLIDEFQDTSSTQYKLLDALLATWPVNDHRTVFAVGDPMQSIYRFRQADVRLFIKLQHEPIRHIRLTPIELKCNFRSSSAIIEQINAMFKDVFPLQNTPHLAAIRYSQATATQQAKSHHGITLYEEENSHPSAQAQLCLRLVQKLLKEHPSERVAVLVQARSHLKHIIPLLESQNIAFNAIDIYPTVNLSAIQDLSALISALTDPFDHLSWHIVLRSPLCGLSLASLDQLPKSTNMHDAIFELSLDNDDQPYLAKFQNALRKALRQECNPVAQVWCIWSDLLGEKIYPKNQQAAIDNWFSATQKRVRESHLINREALLTYFSRSYTSRLDPSAKVSLLTTHKSKGLEYEHVIIPHLEKRKPSAKLPLFYCEANEHPIIQPTFTNNQQNTRYFKHINKQRDNYESMRLFYVACTRAKYTLHLLTQKEDSPKEGSWISGLAAHREKPNNLIVKQTNTEASLVKQQHTISLYRSLAYQHIEAPVANIPPDSEDSIYGTALHYYIQYISHPHLSQKWRYYLANNRLPSTLLTRIQQDIDKLNTVLKESNNAKWVLQKYDWEKNEYSLHHLGKQYILDRVFLLNGRYHIIDFKFPKNKLPDGVLKERYLPQLTQYQEALSFYKNKPIEIALYLPLEDRLIRFTQSQD